MKAYEKALKIAITDNETINWRQLFVLVKSMHIKFGISFEELPFSARESIFRHTACLEEINEYLSLVEDIKAGRKENESAIELAEELVDCFADLAVFILGTIERTNGVYSFQNERYINLSHNVPDLIPTHENIAYYVVANLTHSFEFAFSSPQKLKNRLVEILAVIQAYMNYIGVSNSVFETCFNRVMQANCAKELGGNNKRGGFSVDLVKPEGWKAPVFVDIIPKATVTYVMNIGKTLDSKVHAKV